jgi:Sel1 repeat
MFSTTRTASTFRNHYNMFSVKSAYALTITVLMITCNAFASIELAEASYERKEYETAYQLSLPLAQSGDARAQYLAGLMLWKGRGVAKNDVGGAEWLAKSADQGYALAANDLATMYFSGDGLEKSVDRAAALFKRSAELGNAAGQFNLGRLYENGTGVAKDHVLARYWYERADAQQSDATAAKRQTPRGSFKSKLPEGCRPPLPPMRAMAKLAVKEVTGRIGFYVDADGKIRGVTDKSISVDALKYDAVAHFSSSLRSKSCVLPEEAREIHFEIPFTFVLN